MFRDPRKQNNMIPGSPINQLPKISELPDLSRILDTIPAAPGEDEDEEKEHD